MSEISDTNNECVNTVKPKRIKLINSVKDTPRNLFYSMSTLVFP